MSRPDGSADVARDLARAATDPTLVLLEGLHAVKHALRFGADVVLLAAPDRDATLALAASLAPDVLARLDAELVPVDPAALREALRGRGAEVVGVARRPADGGPADARGGPAVLLDEPRHLGNVGAVVRVAAGFGARAVLTTGTVDPWHPTVVRAAAGLHFATTVRRVAPDTGTDGTLLAFDPAGDDLREVAIPDDAVLAFGSERRGLSASVRRRADRLVAIPMRADVSSYNLATSVAVALYRWSATA